MAESDQRIAQFRNMTEADPDNEMGHFSLGKAYFDAGRFAEAAPCFARVLELNPTHSKSYQLLGESLLKTGKRDEAIAHLRRGYEVAAERGDMMPLNGIAKTLTDLAVDLPKTSKAPTTAAPSSPKSAAGVGFQCARCGRPDGKLPERPFKGELGEKVLAGTCASCWREWIGMGTKVINEMGLQLADPRAQQIYDDQMREFLQLED